MTEISGRLLDRFQKAWQHSNVCQDEWKWVSTSLNPPLNFAQPAAIEVGFDCTQLATMKVERSRNLTAWYTR